MKYCSLGNRNIFAKNKTEKKFLGECLNTGEKIKENHLHHHAEDEKEAGTPHSWQTWLESATAISIRFTITAGRPQKPMTSCKISLKQTMMLFTMREGIPWCRRLGRTKKWGGRKQSGPRVQPLPYASHRGCRQPCHSLPFENSITSFCYQLPTRGLVLAGRETGLPITQTRPAITDSEPETGLETMENVDRSGLEAPAASSDLWAE